MQKNRKLNKVCVALLLGVVCITGLSAGWRTDRAKEVTSAARQFIITPKEDAVYLVSTEDMAAYETETVSGNETGVLTDEIAAVLEQVNLERVQIGLPELIWNDELAKAADIRVKEIKEAFSHVRPDGSEWWTVNEEVIYGENLARGYQSADTVMDAWMKSSEHKDNILYAAFQTIGIAVYESDGQWYWAQEFGY
ncbi:MAG: CAP domain-containing protein [Bacillus sp. (in: Bacteria)]|nr:CAP domain-containing protein [Bacillus sp. (in: firmicutes)]MCM1426423.1 CAP domain-containing protein [Eubacterium sp.]